MKVLDFETIRKAAKSMNPSIWYDWVDEALRHKAEFVCPPKPRMSQADGDYFNVMPAMYEKDNVAMVKIDWPAQYQKRREAFVHDGRYSAV